MAFGLSAGAVAAIGAIGGAAIGAYGSNKAAGKQADAADRATQLQSDQYQQTRADQAPYRDAGYAALSTLGGSTAPGGEFNRGFKMSDYTTDPGYQFRLEQGEQGINRAATASGSRYSGATLKALSRFNSNQASQEFGNSFNRYQTDIGNRFGRLASMAGIGQTATNQTAVAGQAAASGQAQTIQNAGAARASGYVGTANAINGTIGGLVNNYGQQQMLSSMLPNGSNNYNGTSSGYMAPRTLPDSGTVQAAGGWGIE